MISLPLLALLIPLVGALLPWLLRRSPTVRNAVTLLIPLLLLVTVVKMVPTVLAQEAIEVTLISVGPGLSFALEVDALGMLFALVSSSLWILNSLFSFGYMYPIHGNSF